MTEKLTEKLPTKLPAKLQVVVTTVGCRANQADSADLIEHLDADTVELVDSSAVADVAIINTCCVTNEAERDCRKIARRILAASPSARVVFVGCAVNAVSEFGQGIDSRIEWKTQKEAEPGVLARWLNELAGAKSPASPNCSLSRWELGRTRALLKIQNGCSHFCSYCIVPRARGPERSLGREDVLSKARRLAGEGFNEIVLSGVQLGAWGVDLAEKPGLPELVRELASELEGIRIRLSSIEPWSVDGALADALASCENVCAHLHIPLQSGDDGVLRAMRRGYTSSEYLDRVAAVRDRVPDIAIGTDVLVGFPTEDQRAFEGTLRTLEVLKPSYLHAFSYSPRPDTPAAKMEGRPEAPVAKQRAKRVRELGEGWMIGYRQSQIGQTRSALIEEHCEDETRALLDNFLPVRLPADFGSVGQIVQVEVIGEAGVGRMDVRPIDRLMNG